MVPQDTSHEHLDSRPHTERGAGLVSRDFISSLSAEAGEDDGKGTFAEKIWHLFVARKRTAWTDAVFLNLKSYRKKLDTYGHSKHHP